MDLVKRDDHRGLLADIETVRQILADNPTFIKAVHSVVLPRPKRLELGSMLDDHLEFQPLWSSLFEILVHKHRFNILPAVLECIEAAIHAENDEVKVELVLARDHSDNVLAQISRLLQNILKHKVILSATVDPSLIGGFTASTHSMLVDASLRDNLERFAGRKTQ
ncbi:MAG: ATP synthase F1 subunit delta [Candidatus Cloacimonetes bacterium]|nr:ATP synthase F1 subunit delta [Candidatus Cloacimonadota bacterium]